MNEFLNDYEYILLYGIVVNFIATLGYGAYKAVNVEPEKIMGLIERYPPKDETVKLISLWFIPFLGFIYVFKEVWILQKFLNKGFGVIDYIEFRLKQQHS